MLRRVAALAILSSAARLILAVRYYGFDTGDDVEIAQEAFRSALGLTYQPWEIRNLFASEVLVAPLLRIAAAAGVHDPMQLVTVARLPFILLAGVNVVLLYLVGRLWFSERAAALGAALYSIHWLTLVYGSSLYPRIPATTAILGAVLLLAGPGSRQRPAFAGLLLAVAFALRYSEVIFFAGALLLLYFDREREVRGRAMAALGIGFAAGIALLAGGFDWLTWGRPFASLIAFGRYTLIERASSSLVAEQPSWWYLTMLPHWLAPPLLVLMFAGRGKTWGRLSALVLVPLLCLSLIHHKELRYLQGIAPFAMLFAAAGAEVWWQKGRHKLVAVLLILALPLQLTRIGSVQKRSMAAIDAAGIMVSRGAGRVALSQTWAYGGRIPFGNGPVIEELGIPPRRDRLEAVAPHVDCAAMYQSQADAALIAAAEAAGLTSVTVVTSDRSRPVVLMCR